MKITEGQKILLEGVLIKTIEDLDMQDSLEFGTDLNHILTEVKKIKVLK